MGRQPSTSSPADSDTSSDGMMVIFKTIADTTWRMFVPSALGAVIGLQLEAQGMKQAAVWGAIVGIVVSGLLVWQQYRAVNRSER